MLICTRCGHIGRQEGAGCAHILIGLVLCFLGLIPGLLYFIAIGVWYPRCASCKNKGALVPMDSPVGREWRARFSQPPKPTPADTTPDAPKADIAHEDERARLRQMTIQELTEYTDRTKRR